MDNSKKRLFASFAVLTFTLCVFAGIAFADDDAEVDAVGFGADFTVNLGNVTMTAGETKMIDLDAALSEVYENPRTNWGTTASRATLSNSDYSGLPSWMSVATSPNGSLPGSDLSNLNATITLTPTSAQSSQTYEFDMQFNLYYGLNIVYARFACSINVEVEDAGTPVTSVSISGGTSGTVGGTITLTATTSPTGADNRHVTWSITSGSNYASISSTTNTTSGGTCKLSLNGAGSVTVRADAADGKGAYDTHTITITEQKITSLSISAGSGGSSITLTAKYSPSTANPDLTWEIISGDSSGYLSSYSGSSTTVYPDSYGRMQIRVTDEISGRTATDYIYVFEMAFNANGGSSAPSSILAIDDLSTYRIDIPSSEPYRSGWEFMGWSTSSSGSPSYEYGDDYSCSYSSLRTMYAIWGDYGYLTFNKNGGSGSVPSQQSLLIQEDDYDYITIPSSPTPTMSGMEFVGWCTNSSGTGTIYYPGDDVDVDCGDTVLHPRRIHDPHQRSFHLPRMVRRFQRQRNHLPARFQLHHQRHQRHRLRHLAGQLHPDLRRRSRSHQRPGHPDARGREHLRVQLQHLQSDPHPHGLHLQGMGHVLPGDHSRLPARRKRLGRLQRDSDPLRSVGDRSDRDHNHPGQRGRQHGRVVLLHRRHQRVRMHHIRVRSRLALRQRKRRIRNPQRPRNVHRHHHGVP